MPTAVVVPNSLKAAKGVKRHLLAAKKEVGGWNRDPSRARYGCFLPDLTGLARNSSTANLPGHYIRV